MIEIGEDHQTDQVYVPAAQVTGAFNTAGKNKKYTTPTSGYISLYQLSEPTARVRGQAYWITYDGVLVKGDNKRTVEKGRKVKVDAEEEGQMSADALSAEAASAITTTELDVRSMFVGADEVDHEDPFNPSNPDVDLLGYTVSLSGDIALNYYFKLSNDVLNDSGAHMEFVLPGGNHTDPSVSVSAAKKETVNGETCYKFTAGIAAKNMTDTITAQFVHGDGTREPVIEYSIKKYCNSIIRNEEGKYTDKEIAVAKSMLNYGGYAQINFGYKTDDLANADLEDVSLPEVNLGPEFGVVKSEELCNGVTYSGSTVMLTTTTDIRHYFKIQGDAEDYQFEVNGQPLAIEQDSNGTYVAIKSIPAKNLKDMYRVTVTNKTDGSRFTLDYGVYTYIKRIVENDTGKYSEKAKNAMRAMYQFGQAALDYFGN